MFELSRPLVLGHQARWPQAKPEVIRLFEEEGFESLGDSTTLPLAFVRGTWISTVMALGPHKWKVRARVSQDVLDGVSRLIITFNVYTHGQILTHAEREYFIAMLKQLQRSVHIATHALSTQQAMVLYGGEDFAMTKQQIAKKSVVALVVLMGVVPVSGIIMLMLFGGWTFWPPLIAMCISICIWMMVTNSKKTK